MSCSCSRAFMLSANTSFGSLCTFSFSFVQDILPAHILHIKILYILWSECKLFNFLEYFISSADFSDLCCIQRQSLSRDRNFFAFAFLMSLQFVVQLFFAHLPFHELLSSWPALLISFMNGRGFICRRWVNVAHESLQPPQLRSERISEILQLPRFQRVRTKMRLF